MTKNVYLWDGNPNTSHSADDRCLSAFQIFVSNEDFLLKEKYIKNTYFQVLPYTNSKVPLQKTKTHTNKNRKQKKLSKNSITGMKYVRTSLN